MVEFYDPGNWTKILISSESALCTELVPVEIEKSPTYVVMSVSIPEIQPNHCQTLILVDSVNTLNKGEIGQKFLHSKTDGKRNGAC